VERVRILTSDDELRQLAAQYCEETVDSGAIAGADHRELSIRLRTVDGDGPATVDGIAERWTGAPPRLTVRFGDMLETALDVDEAVIDGWVRDSLVRDHRSVAGRLLVEAPLAAVRAGQGWQVVHAATVVGPAGAVVVRGPADSGKSTLAAAACKAGLEVLGDESILVRRPDHTHVVAAVREVLVDRTTAAALDLTGRWTETTGGERKLRLDLPPIPVSRRSATHVATVLLGARDQSGGAGLTRLEPGELETLFPAGEIPQERWYGSLEALVRDWAHRPAYRLDGAVDLDGAVEMLARLGRGESP
jgi:hypothetical protein